MDDRPVWLPQIAGLQPLEPIPPAVGRQLAAEQVVGRDEQIGLFWHYLTLGSCQLNDPRRFGKTSTLRRMELPQLVPPGWTIVQTSVQGVRNTRELVECVLADIAAKASLSDRIRTGLRSFFADSEVKAEGFGLGLTLRGAAADDPLITLRIALGDVSDKLAHDDAVLLIVWDEFPDMVATIIDSQGEAAAKALLDVLRRFREQYPHRIRWLLTGSVGLHHILRRLDGSKHVNDLNSLLLGPLSGAWADWLAGSLLFGARQNHFTLETIHAVVVVTDGIPYLMNVFGQYLVNHGIRDLPLDQIDRLRDEAFGDLEQSQTDAYLLTRIPVHYGPLAYLAETALDALLQGPATRCDLLALLPVSPPATDVDAVLEWLTLDHYLTRDATGAYAWRYPALARIWKLRRQ